METTSTNAKPVSKSALLESVALDDSTDCVAPGTTCRDAGTSSASSLTVDVDVFLMQGIAKFNMDAVDGIQYCIDHFVLDGSPHSVASFLLEHNGKLDKAEIGRYLCRHECFQQGFCVKVLVAFLDQLDFTGLPVDEAIRKLVAYFRLPGEAQQIDRLLETFSVRYHALNPTLLPSSDVAYFLSFSVALLQTDLHNPSIPVARKMTKTQFIKANKGIHCGGDVASDVLEGIYDRIQARSLAFGDRTSVWSTGCAKCHAPLPLDEENVFSTLVVDNGDFCEVLDSWSVVKHVSLCSQCWGDMYTCQDVGLGFCEICPDE